MSRIFSDDVIRSIMGASRPGMPTAPALPTETVVTPPNEHPKVVIGTVNVYHNYHLPKEP
jgi:hypothetical protein